MTPPSWTPYYRTSDHELVGYLVGDARPTPVNLAGYPLADASEAVTARAVLESQGLASLDQVWLWWSGGQEIEVRILSAYPGRILVGETTYGYFGPDNARHELTVPADLRPAPRH